jgi:ABC-type multidrug transport system fused ATPase/permease subunit
MNAIVTSNVFPILQKIFQANVRSITLTYLLTFLENLFELFYPLAIGFAIDQMLKQNYYSLLPFLTVWTVHVATALGRRVYDTKTFTRIYSNFATNLVLEQQAQGASTAKIAARSMLSREFVEFFECDVPLLITSLFSFFGALVMLFIYDWPIGLCSLTLLVPLVLINQRYAKKSQALHQHLNDQLEQEVEILTNPQRESLQLHYRQLAKWRVRLSNAEAGNYGLMELFTIVLFAVVLIRTVQLPQIQAGTIYAVISYLWNFLRSLDGIPLLVQQFSRLQDIGTRMQVSDESPHNALIDRQHQLLK